MARESTKNSLDQIEASDEDEPEEGKEQTKLYRAPKISQEHFRMFFRLNSFFSFIIIMIIIIMIIIIMIIIIMILFTKTKAA